jgi:signal transduction histidine kinase
MANSRSPRDTRKSDASLPDLLARMGHELRTPLNAILGFSELMATAKFGPLGSPRYEDYARHIHTGARELLATLDAMHRYTRLERGLIEPQSVAIDLGNLLRRTFDAATRMQHGRLTHAVDTPPTPIVVTNDPELLHEAVTALITNAIAFTPDGGRVDASLGLDDAGLPRIAITDSGVGIPEDQLEAVLEPFVQLRPAGVKAHRGPGLGLATARALS